MMKHTDARLNISDQIMFIWFKKILVIAVIILCPVVSALAGNWQFLGLSDRTVLSVACDPENSQNICAGTDSGLYVSFDGGQNWAVRLSLDASFPFLSYSPYSNDTLLATYSNSSVSDGLYISVNNGNSWSHVGNFLNPRRVGFDPLNPGFIYICFSDGILKSQDYGQSFNNVNDGLPDTDIKDVKGDGTNQYEAYAVGNTFVAHTTNFGSNWLTLNGLFSLPDYYPNRIEFEPNGPETLYVSCHTVVARSVNGGLTWNYTSMPVDGITPIVCDSQVAGKLYVGSVNSGGVFRSTDAGTSFSTLNDSLGNLSVHSLAIDADDNLYAGTEAGIYKYDFTSGIFDNKQKLPKAISLFHNYPNPFNSRTMIKLFAEKSQYIELDIYDISGRKVKSLYQGNVQGSRSFSWDGKSDNGTSVTSGVYLYGLRSNNELFCRKMVLLK